MSAADLSRGMNGYTDSRVLPFSQAEAAYNVCVESGALKNGYGVVSTVIPSEMRKVFYYNVFDENAGVNRGYYIAYRSDGRVYSGAGAPHTWKEIEGIRFSSPPLGLNYRLYSQDVFLLCGEDAMAVIDSELRASVVSGAPPVTSLAMHNERMFVTIGGRKNAVWFSDDLDPTNWNPELDEGGFIELEGEHGRLNKAVAFGGYVYVFCDYGIVRLSAYGAQSDFSVTNLFVSSGKIYADTVCVCGDRILFLASDGIYSFDGLTATKILRHLDGLISGGAQPLGSYSAGKYYIACASENSKVNDLLIVTDPRTKAVSVAKGMNISAFSAIVEKSGEILLVATPEQFLGTVNANAKYFGRNLKKVWRSGMTDCGYPDRRKLVSEVYLDTEYDCTVTVSTEKKSKSFKFAGKPEVQKKRVNIVGTKVRVEITAEGDISAARPTVKFTLL